jgi:hypothetical protein
MLMQWEKSIKCPCIQIGGSGQPDFNCTLCMGKGWYWFDPQQIQVLVTGISQEFRYENPGEISTGTANVTTLPQYRIGYYDRFSNFDSQMRHSELIKKGDHNGKDKTRFQPIEIIYCRDLTREYVPKIDFDYDPNSYEINWLPTGYEPNSGTRYSVEYYTHPRWIAIQLYPIRDTFVKRKKPTPAFQQMPVRAMVRLEWMVFGIVDP